MVSCGLLISYVTCHSFHSISGALHINQLLWSCLGSKMYLEGPHNSQ